ncbi:ATP-dependent helicase [Sporosarcina sp. resist]|uniref:UvrD-helicase domain-containing protein n=1 Tax=Sporosarcina sp. resist TaxID=2762563 RepID=UPI00164D48E6|nr:ATP-dependent helicase [Sporosarcina sp. resist]QNK89865.1 ATP-dependent helicase [Sporosarcina sp. resist]
MIDNDDFRKSIAYAPVTDSIVVQAGPGSGKTKILIERLKYIIENRPQSYSGIACITYTNAAKDEIITRLQNDGFQLPKDLFIGTIHSFLLDHIIKPYSHFANKKKEPYKLASYGFARKYKQEIGEMLNRPTHFISESIYRAFESLGRDEEGEPFCFQNRITPEVARIWKDITKEEGYIDQQDVIYLSYLILNGYEHIRNAFSSHFPYVLVDEYQDVTFYQEKVFKLMERTSFFCVGDRNQSIYSFTGAKPEIFQSKWAHECYASYTLSNNLRSTEHIVKFANHKTGIIQLEAGLNASSEQMVIFIKDVNEDFEVLQIFNRIRGEVECENPYNPYMILARENDYVKKMGYLLKNQDMESNPFLRKLKKEHYRRFRILENLLLAISYKRRNEFDQAVERMSEAFSYLFFNEHPNFVALSEIGFDKFMWKKLQIFTLFFLDNIDLTEISVASLFLQVKEFLSVQSKKLYDISIGRKILMLNYKWKNQSRAAKNTMVSHLLEQVELQSNLSESGGHLFSIHGAKGQEAECVLVMAESESQLTEWLGKNEESEEARVGYVAFSRARKLLCVWAPSIKEENYLHLQKHVKFVDSSYATEIESV